MRPAVISNCPLSGLEESSMAEYSFGDWTVDTVNYLIEAQDLAA
jgi:hypothetical protein